MKNNVEGVVVERCGNVAKVHVSMHASCTSCGSCGGSGATIVDAENSIGAELGQRVVMEVIEHNVLTSAFIVYLLPLVLPVIGYIFGYYIFLRFGRWEYFCTIGSAFVMLIVSLVYIKLHDKKVHSQQDLPVIVAVKN